MYCTRFATLCSCNKSLVGRTNAILATLIPYLNDGPERKLSVPWSSNADALDWTVIRSDFNSIFLLLPVLPNGYLPFTLSYQNSIRIIHLPHVCYMPASRRPALLSSSGLGEIHSQMRIFPVLTTEY
jgi:hypothetical protein